ncbi:MAG: hypothetical protein PHO83_04825 [Geobacteraceae bacterium]|nr:hypothetical protein [Geobacteraceae bacterium]
MLKVLKENRYEFALLGLALLWVGGSLLASLAWPKGNWFCRSGAVMVLLAVIVEFHLGNLQQAENSNASVIAGLGIPVSGDLPKIKQHLAKAAHIFAISGTLIWGYGDLLI